MIIKKQDGGWILISDIVDGQWVKRRYLYYSEYAAKKDFQEEFRKTKEV
jgi:hypothetical protein